MCLQGVVLYKITEFKEYEGHSTSDGGENSENSYAKIAAILLHQLIQSLVLKFEY